MTVNEAIKVLQRAKREQAKLILQNRKGVKDMKEAMKLAGEVFLFRRVDSRHVEYIGFDCETTSVAHEYYSSRGIILNMDVEY